MTGSRGSPQVRPDGAQLGAVPLLAEVLVDPALVKRLSPGLAVEYRRALRRLDIDLEAHIAASTGRAETLHEPAEADRAVRLDEAATILDMERRTLERKSKWQRLGGYKDLDGRVKFRLADLRRYLARRRSMG